MHRKDLRWAPKARQHTVGQGAGDAIEVTVSDVTMRSCTIGVVGRRKLQLAPRPGGVRIDLKDALRWWP